MLPDQGLLFNFSGTIGIAIGFAFDPEFEMSKRSRKAATRTCRHTRLLNA